MPPETRSELIIELLNDPRERVCLLGFELASRDLSSGGTLSAKAADATVELMGNPLPSIRTGAARLITRLALPDAMPLINTALESEQNATVAQALLRGVERWPSPESRDAVLRWYQPSTTNSTPSRTDTQIAAASAAWSIADLDLWDTELHAPALQEVYRAIDDHDLTDADLKLIASTGASSDIDRLINLMENPSNPNTLGAAEALVISPRAVDQLINQATRLSEYTPAAAQAIELHRLNPAGVLKLASLNWKNEQDRTTALIQTCSKLAQPQLADAVRIMRTEGTITDSLSIQLLDRLVAGSQSVSARSAPGVVLLAQLELNNERPDRALEILSLLPESGIQPDSAFKAKITKATAHIVLSEFDQATLIDSDLSIWINALAIPDDQATRSKIAQEIVRRDYQLTPEQQTVLDSIIDLDQQTEPANTDPENSERNDLEDPELISEPDTDPSSDPQPDSQEPDSLDPDFQDPDSDDSIQQSSPNPDPQDPKNP
ncbi:MAG: hypothetical protein AB8C13_00900 [Phycisphaerales bacterium]